MTGAQNVTADQDYRAMVQDMKPLDAVDYLLEVIEGLIGCRDAVQMWEWPGVHLAPAEKLVLQMLAKAAGRPVSTEMLLAATQQGKSLDEFAESNLIRTHVSRLRTKLAGRVGTIRAIRCQGYQLDARPGVVWPWGQA